MAAVNGPKKILAVNQCQVLLINIVVFWLLGTGSGCIQLVSNLATMGHVTKKVSLRLDSDKHTNIITK